MVRRTDVLPLLSTGQDAGVMAIWASVTPGSSEAAALRTAARAAAGSFCSAISRTPSRAAAESVPCTWKARPNSAMPITRTMSSGMIIANSTAVAPRSLRIRSRILLTSVLDRSCRTAAQRPPRGEPLRRGAAERLGRTSGKRVRDHREQAVQTVTEQRHGGDDDDGDQTHHEAVLDGGGA